METLQLHFHDGRSNKLEGFMKTLIKSLPFDGNYGVHALDCEDGMSNLKSLVQLIENYVAVYEAIS